MPSLPYRSFPDTHTQRALLTILLHYGLPGPLPAFTTLYGSFTFFTFMPSHGLFTFTSFTLYHIFLPHCLYLPTTYHYNLCNATPPSAALLLDCTAGARTAFCAHTAAAIRSCICGLLPFATVARALRTRCLLPPPPFALLTCLHASFAFCVALHRDTRLCLVCMRAHLPHIRFAATTVRTSHCKRRTTACAARTCRAYFASPRAVNTLPFRCATVRVARTGGLSRFAT